MDFKIRVITIVVVTFILTLIVSMYQFQQGWILEKKSMQKNQLEAQVDVIRDAAESMLRLKVQELIKTAERNFPKVELTNDRLILKGDLNGFLGVAWLENKNATTWIALENQFAKSFSIDEFEKQKTLFPLLIVNGENVIVTRIQDDKGRPLFALLVELQFETEKSGVVVGLISKESFSQIGAVLKSKQGEFILSDDKGFVLNYNQTQYIGSQLIHHPVLEEIINSKSVFGSGEGKTLDGKIASYAFQKLNYSNLYIAALLPIGSGFNYFLNSSAKVFGIQIILLLITSIWLVWLVNKNQLSFSWLKDAVKKISNGQSILLPDARLTELSDIKDELVALNSQAGKKYIESESSDSNLENKSATDVKETNQINVQNGMVNWDLKLELLNEVGSGFIDSFRPKISVILGHAQLARSKANEHSEIKNHIAVIERETRQMRSVVENFENIIKPEELKLEKVEFQDLILKLIANQRIEFSEKGIQIKKNLKAQGFVNVDFKAMSFIFKEIFDNAINSMEHSTNREIEVSSYTNDNKIVVKIKDSGKGIESSALNKVFEPFYTTKKQGETSGLGLTLTKRLIAKMNGEIFLESEVGSGLTVVVKFPNFSTDLVSKHQNVEEKKQINISEIKFLENIQPLSGTDADLLPAPPELDEITLVGEKNPALLVNDNQSVDKSELKIESTAEDQLISDSNLNNDNQIKIKTTENLMNDIIQSELYAKSKISKDFHVQVRSPKLRGKN